MKNFDVLISDFIKDWENALPFQKYRKSVSYAVIYKLYDEIRKNYSTETTMQVKSKTPGLFSTKFIHTLWYMLWTVKWIFLHRKIHNYVIFTSLYPDRPTTFRYIDSINSISRSNKLIILNFGMLYNMKYLFSKSIICIPVAVMKLFIKISFSEQEMINSIDYGLKECINRKFSLKNPKISIANELQNLIKLEKIFINIIMRFNKSKVIIITDTDYSGHGLLFILYSKSKNLYTISVEHSFIPYDHLFREKYADTVLVWGDYHKDRIIKLSENKCEIIKTGYPIPLFKINEGYPKYWLYILSSYNKAGIQTINRNITSSYENISQIYSIMSEKKTNFRLLIRRHPNDFPIDIPCEYFQGNLSRILPNTELVFFEDTSLFLSLLRVEIPLIYVTDLMGNDWYKIVRYPGAVNICRNIEEFPEVIKQSLKNKINMKEREALLNYFSDTKIDFNGNMQNVIKKKLGIE